MSRCPHCKQAMPPVYKPQKVCCECKKPIERGHKWQWILKKNCSMIAHRHCDNPGSYKPKKAEAK